eukprot:4350343-Pyramimonas_sp.AAC.1
MERAGLTGTSSIGPVSERLQRMGFGIRPRVQARSDDRSVAPLVWLLSWHPRRLDRWRVLGHLAVCAGL